MGEVNAFLLGALQPPSALCTVATERHHLAHVAVHSSIKELSSSSSSIMSAC
jgi:hypothetical protein